MNVFETLKSAVLESDNAQTTLYKCQDCGHTFESAKAPEEAQCMECLSREVTEQ